MEQNSIAVKLILDRWNGALASFNKTLNSLTDEDLEKEISPGRNRGIYLLGHMVAVHDDMVRLLDWGNKHYPELAEPFLSSPDRTVADIPSAKDLREKWNKISEFLDTNIAKMSTDEWFQKHTAVPAEEFANEPHRNKLNIILTRTTHLTYHTGQIVLIKK